MEEWKEFSVHDITRRVKVGFVGSCENDYCNKTETDAIPMIRTTDLTNYIIHFDNQKFVTRTFHEKNIKSQLHKHDLLIARHGDNGKTCIYESDEPANCLNVVIIEPDNNKCDYKFLKYMFDSSSVKNILSGTLVGSVQPVLNTKTVENLIIKIPPLPTQQKIAAILSSLDDKIELNNKINTNLEQQAQALFKNWFVDFEPFGGKMPEGWKLGTVGDLCSTVSKTYKGNDSHVVLINTSDVEDGTILNHESVPNSKLKGQFKKTFQKNDILYSEIRPANKHYAFVDIETTSNYIASTKLMVIRPNEGINPHYLYHILTNPDLIQEMQHLAETRSGTFPQITFESELSTYQIPLLPKEEQDKLGELFEKIDNQIFHNIKENKMLSTIRDTLLPKVMNGEIKI